MYYGDHGAYAPHADSLRIAFGDDVKAFVLWGDNLNEPDGGEASRAGADFLIPVAKDV